MKNLILLIPLIRFHILICFIVFQKFTEVPIIKKKMKKYKRGHGIHDVSYTGGYTLAINPSSILCVVPRHLCTFLFIKTYFQASFILLCRIKHYHGYSSKDHEIALSNSCHFMKLS